VNTTHGICERPVPCQGSRSSSCGWAPKPLLFPDGGPSPDVSGWRESSAPCQKGLGPLTGHNSSETSNSPTVPLAPLSDQRELSTNSHFGFPVMRSFRIPQLNAKPSRATSFGSYAHAGKQCGCLSGEDTYAFEAW
jgi:hypothetical protein